MNFLQILLEEILSEGLEGVIKGNPDIHENIIRQYHDLLPTSNKSDNLLKFMLKLHRNKEISPTTNELKTHIGIISNNKINVKNVSTLKDIEAVTKSHLPIYDKNGMTVEQHKNHKEAIKAANLDIDNPNYNYTNLKGKAQWCVSSDNKKGCDDFDYYTNHSKKPLYTIKTPDNRKYAFVADDTIKKDGVMGIFQNEFNATVDPADFIKKYPEIRNVKEIYPFIKHTDLATKEGISNLSNDEIGNLGYRASKYGDMNDIEKIKAIAPHLNDSKKESLLNGMSHEYPDPQFLEHLPAIHRLLRK